MDKKIVYKVVVEKLDKSLWSYNTADDPTASPEIKLRYRVGKRRMPAIKNSKLFAFDTLDNALQLLRIYNSYRTRIYRAEATTVDILKCSDFAYVTPAWVKTFWENLNTCRGRPLHKGTVVCGSIKLLERVR